MSIKYTIMDLPGVLLLEPKVFNDSRGFFMETFHQKKYADAGIDHVFVQDNYSHSTRGTLRGLHYQLNHPQGKLVYVITGEIYDVAVDIRRGSPGFGKWVGAYLSEKNRRQVFVPEGFAHGFCVVSETADVLYKTTDLYNPDDEYGVVWSDPSIGIDWPVEVPTVSDKDKQYPGLKEAPEIHLPIYQ
ncbi:dTDP-4-dehydrorhamnose 3,5-epimerase [Candidatus Scalindua japonica]|uniref:dTDP-4-dehydrorhamnose 3,5-epimerase n=1 Tax=Candidatus Scalindua japonica TaxID=1284222 RepID=A0A286U4F0_9BACT|nr:dTDP-4-dehydrorhamnose 3,5-epimerase [Candidatus Scalindua japonica]GAX63019.1 dTDP-4-dehydrorhamnose 3,5-epimerase [Candidatus Scalindua japonica]